MKEILLVLLWIFGLISAGIALLMISYIVVQTVRYFKDSRK